MCELFRYVDRIAENLKRKLTLAKKYEGMISSHEKAIKSSQLEEASLRPKVAFLIDESKEWQKLVSLKSLNERGQFFHIQRSIVRVSKL